jgi:5-methylcytosine-specific restriction endonuclease McrA
MAKDTPSMAKNKMRRSLLAIVDPHPSPTEIDLLWSYFQSCCAYCGVTITRDSRTGHVDHVVSSALGGSNCIYNHVLSCARCNGDDKREEPWESFLAKKVSDRALFAERHARISTWLSRSPGRSIPPDVRAHIDAIIDQAIGDFDSAVQELRALRKVAPDDSFKPKPLCGSA